uniref:Uncharacterized protein n=1 Tax=Anopheles maculatus TaxID=74869 RepID=A0A182SQJ5_9DIPT
MPFIVTPPLARLEANSELTLRIRRNGEPLPTDRESVFFISMKAVPAKKEANDSGASGQMALTVVSNMKLFYRPEGLAKRAVADVASQLRFHRDGDNLIANNPTPYWLTFSQLKVGNVELGKPDLRLMVPPKGQQRALLLTGTVPASARDYFDPALLALAGDQAVTTDLSSYETAGRVPEGSYLVSLWVNQADQGPYTLAFKKNAQGEVQPELTPAFLHHLGVNTTALPQFKGLPEEVPVNDLTTLIPEARVHFDLAQLRLDLSIPQIAMQQNARGSVDPAQWDDGVPAILMNYSL